MPINDGSVRVEMDDGAVSVKIYYSTTYVPPAGKTYMDAPLVNGPRGYCLDVTNTSGRPVKVSVRASADLARNVVIPAGDPVTAGTARSRTAAQLAAAGFTTRGSVSELTLS